MSWDDIGYSPTNEKESYSTDVDVIHSILSTSLSKAYSELNQASPDEYARKSEILAMELREYIEIIADNYHQSPFHSFRHAKQVVLNTNHLIELSIKHPGSWSMTFAQAFCLLFSALIHDVDHRGLTNAYMIKENLNGLSTKYPDGSLAEHKSIDLSLALLNESKFHTLREIICSLNYYRRSSVTTPRIENPDLSTFEALVTTLLLSTDIMNPQRTAVGRSKWVQTFNTQDDATEEQLDRKDEAILEQLLQLADIGHCTQRWETLVLWNQRLLTELVSAAMIGKGVDPSDIWFNGQISFFDNYIIPLSERIRVGDIFSQDICDKFLTGALRNKVRWNEEGTTVCEQMKETARADAMLQLSASSRDSGIDIELSKPVVDTSQPLQQRPSLSSTAPSTATTSDNFTQSQPNIWSRLSYWNDGSIQLQDNSYWEAIMFCICTLPRRCHACILTMKRHPMIPLISMITFAGLCTLGLLFIQYIDKLYVSERKSNALRISNDIGKTISDAFDQALVPMYTLSKFIMMQDVFYPLPHLIDMTPLMNGSSTIRNVTGLCSADENNFSSSFKLIAQSILYNSNLTMTKVGTAVSDIRVAPYGVQCLIYPAKINEIGNDWKLSSRVGQRNIIQKTVFEDRLYILPLPSEVFCTHIPIHVPNQNYSFSFANATRQSWGFVQMFFNWTKIKENMKLDEQFKAHDLGYNIYFDDSGKVSAVANSTSFSSLKTKDIVSSRVQTSYNSTWVIEAGFINESRDHDNTVWLDIIVVCASFVIMVLMLIHLITRQKHKDLLYKMMPRSAIKKINRGETVVEKFDLVTIFFCDIVGFTTMAGEMTPLTVMEMLNDLYLEFDKLTVKHKIYKVETIGDCFMAIGGAPDRCTGPVASQKIALFALDILKCVEAFRTRQGDRISVRIGLASGSVVAGVVGDVMPRYCFFGDTVNFASRMESTSREMTIQCSDLTYQLLLNAPDYSFVCEERRSEGSDPGVFVKGKGHTHTWWVLGSTELHTKELNAKEDA